MLQAMGCCINGVGTSKIEIHPSPLMKGSLTGTTWHVMPDRIEVGTYLAAAAITGHVVPVREPFIDRRAHV